MKKMLVVMVLLAVAATVAGANTLGIPWFTDNALQFVGVPSSKLSGATGQVILKSNESTPLTCYICYYNSAGQKLGPFEPYNSFVISPLSSLSFRPVAFDPDASCGSVTIYNADGSTSTITGQNGGQEGPAGVLVPNRPVSPDTNTAIPNTTIIDTKKNGSCVISWFGAANGDKAIQGFYSMQATSTLQSGGVTYPVTMSYAHLLPTGI